MPTVDEIRGFEVGTQYKDPISDLPPGTELGGILPIKYNNNYLVFCKVLEADGKEATLEVIKKMHGTPCRKLGYNSGWGNNLCSALDRPCNGPGLEEACATFRSSEIEKAIIRCGEGSATRRDGAGRLIVLDPLDFQ